MVSILSMYVHGRIESTHLHVWLPSSIRHFCAAQVVVVGKAGRVLDLLDSIVRLLELCER
jgi:hypothetical protein